MSTLYVEPFSGMSGDMFLGALAGLADAYGELEGLPKKIGLPDGEVRLTEVEKNGIVCVHVEVVDLNAAKSRHDHHSHHDHDDGHHHHDHGHGRHLSDILGIIDGAEISDGAKDIARGIFQLIGEAESQVHQIPIETIHFHEISGVDSIIDIVGAAVLLDKLQIKRCIADPVCVGFGMVKTQHGLLPVPAPATAKLLKGIPSYKGDEEGERVTPTGAAILQYLKPEFGKVEFSSKKIAYGPGKKDFIAPNVLRLSLGETGAAKETLVQLETNLDDCSPEILGDGFQEGLLAAGAIDFSMNAVQMKKGRTGTLLSVLTSQAELESVADFVLEKTTSIGVRYYMVERKILSRSEEKVDTEYGEIRFKVVETPSGGKRAKAEYNDLNRLANKYNVSVEEIRRAAEMEYWK
ncbi:MAG: nickel pincer cofactor biosynthesis protein LarC [Verrucomicrobiota bacterium]